MKANELQINTFLQVPNVQYVIPVYQRNYDWTNIECKQLLNDLISVVNDKRETHFVGSIVFIHEGTFCISEVRELVIIDGQQRLTTINILYVALYRFAKENGLADEAERLYNIFLTNQYVKSDESKLKLKQTDNNSMAFKSILNGTERQYNQYSNVIENFNYYRSVINEENFQTILNGINRLVFVEISLERGKDDPQRIFESLNSTGLALSQSDLIRNYILMDLAPKNQQRVFDAIWHPIEQNARDLVKQKSMVSDFIRDFLTLRNKKIPNKNKVYDEFKQIYTDKKDEHFLQELDKMKSLSVHYKKFINPGEEKNSTICKQLDYINRLEINVAFPFLLQVFEDADNGLIDKSTLVQILKLIQSYTWRRFIVGLPTNALNKVFMTLYSEVDSEEYYESIARALLKKKGSGKFPNDEDVKTSLKDRDLYNSQPKNRNYLFEMLENYNNNEIVDTNSEKITIEHIFPRNPAESWNAALPAAELSLFKEKYLNTIGNLTLSGNNGALGNKSFLEKRDMNVDDQQQGYKFSRLWLNNHLKKLDSWNLETLEERFNVIYDRFIKVWEYPKVEIDEDDNYEEVNIFDAEIPTFRKLEYFIFEETKVDESAVAQMYFFIIRNLYAKNPQLLTTNPEVLKIKRTPSDFRAPQEVINGWFVESNIDSNTKFGILKNLLTLFDMEDELIIKYSTGTENGNEPGRYALRKRYWQQLLDEMHKIDLLNNISSTKDHWLSTGAGISGLAYCLIIGKSGVRIELAISSSDKEQNKRYFKKLLTQKDSIEKAYGNAIQWDELPDNKMSRLRIELEGLSAFVESNWPMMNEFFIMHLPKFIEVLRPFIAALK